MDLLRYSSGSGAVEDGYVYDQRVMQGGQGFEVISKLENGRWMVEMKRALSSDQPGDLSLALDQVYNFGFAIHDDYSNARFHHVSLGYRMGFDNDQVDINVVKREAAAVSTPAAAPANASAAAPAAGNTTAANSAGFDVDWSKAGSRDITIFLSRPNFHGMGTQWSRSRRRTRIYQIG